MRPQVLMDTGALVALLDQRDRYHAWAKAQMATLAPPALTCESVLTEATFLLRNLHGGGARVMDLIQREALHIPFRLEEHHEAIARLLTRYADVPMSLADACLVRMSELVPESTVFTLDTDFHIYRRNRRQAIPLMIPPDRR